MPRSIAPSDPQPSLVRRHAVPSTSSATSAPASSAQSAPRADAHQKFWPEGWWKLMEYRIGIIPLPVYVMLLLLISGFAISGKVPGEISMAIAVLAFFGFTCAEIGKRLPIVRHIGAAAIFATFIPSALTYYHWLPKPILSLTSEFTKQTNFLYLFIASIIVGSILSMDRRVLIRGFIKIFVPLALGSVAAGIVGTLVGTLLGLGAHHTFFISWHRSWRAVSARVRSRCL